MVKMDTKMKDEPKIMLKIVKSTNPHILSMFVLILVICSQNSKQTLFFLSNQNNHRLFAPDAFRFDEKTQLLPFSSSFEEFRPILVDNLVLTYNGVIWGRQTPFSVDLSWSVLGLAEIWRLSILLSIPRRFIVNFRW